MKSTAVMIVVAIMAIMAFQTGVLVGMVAHRFMRPADSPLVESCRQLERDFNTPRLEWQQ
jgi:Na+-translocating ferredoxin:NAD+ oxidoreductase RNF subunit RnfB